MTTASRREFFAPVTDAAFRRDEPML